MMKKRNLPIALLLISSVLITLLNSCSSASGEHTEPELDIQNIVYTKIAVVNSDMGIEIDGERQNYSAAIINALEDEFTLVSPAMAESGYENGAYSAVITFPSDVSAKILSFNSQQPEKVQLEFKVNPNLNECDYIDTYLRIMNLQVSINARSGMSSGQMARRNQAADALEIRALQNLGHGLQALQDIDAHGQISANDGKYNFGHATTDYVFASPDNIYRLGRRVSIRINWNYECAWPKIRKYKAGDNTLSSRVSCCNRTTSLRLPLAWGLRLSYLN